MSSSNPSSPSSNGFHPAMLVAVLIGSLTVIQALYAAPAAKHSSTKAVKSSFSPPVGALVGWAVRDAATDSLLTGSWPERNFTPASTQKLFSTWIALDLLGADRTFATELFYTGSLQGNRLTGDLIIQGGGDPSLGDSQLGKTRSAEVVFNTWLEALKKMGVAKIEGCILGDGSYLTEEGPQPAMLWEDAGNYYAGTVSGLSFNGNLFRATFSGAATPGKPVALQGTSPKHSGISHFANSLLTGPTNSGDSAYFLGGYPATVREVRGSYPAGKMPFTIKGSLPNPAWTCAREFQDFLEAHGIKVAAGKTACGDSSALPNMDRPSSGTPIPEGKITSPSLRELVRHTNQRSDNAYAAQLLALIGKESGKRGDWRGGLLRVNQYLSEHGFVASQVHLKDGNGLSRYNWISPAQTSHLLAFASKQKAFPDFQASLLGSPGEDGNLDRWGKGWEGRLWVKTGTLEGVSALAGYLKAKSGRLLAFAITANNFEGKANDMQSSFSLLLKEWANRY